ncbi:MAG: phosphatidylglycerol lysyltransferase domain-containing protein [Streptosporangiaceae bacterium]
MSRGLTFLSEMTDHNGLGPAAPRTGDDEQQHATRAVDRRQLRRWVPLTAGVTSLFVGLGYIVEGVLPGLTARRLKGLSYLGSLTRTADIIIGLLLLMVSHGLRRRKHRAWEAVLALLGAGLLVHVVLGFLAYSLDPNGARPAFRPVSTTVSAILIVALIFYRREFYAVGDRRTRWRALWVLCYLVLADVLIGLAYLSLSRGLSHVYSPWDRVKSVIFSLVGFSGPVQFRAASGADHFAFVTGALGLFTLVVAAFMFLRPARRASRMTAADADQIRALLVRYGDQDSLGYFALRNDKNVIWSPSGKACIGYRVLSGVMLASGDPIGDPEAWPGVINAFLDEAGRHAWVPAVVGCGELGAEVWCREGNLTALELGDEAVVSVTDFSLEGRAMRNVRQMVGRVCRQGYVAEVRRIEDIPQAEIDRMVRQADSWRGSPTERGFSMALGRVGGQDDGRCVVATATQDGVLRALLHFVPWGSDGLSLDLMRRDRSAAPGLNDFLIVEAIKAAAGLGVKRISLNFAVFRAALERGERIGAGPVLRAWRGVLLFLSRWFQIESLYKFNAKFSPEWVPRFLVFPGTRDAPRIGLAALEAEAFLVWPTFEIRRIARKLGLGRLRRRIATARQRPADG